MTLTNYILLSILIVAIAYFIILLRKVYLQILQQRTKGQNKALLEYFPKACAGSDPKNDGAKGVSASVETNRFFDPEGRLIDTAKYNKFVVVGDSMSLWNIYNNDLLFVPKDFNPDQLTTLPKSLVIKRRNANPDSPQYKVRRTWLTCSINDDFNRVILPALFETPDFRVLLASDKCPDVQILTADFFKERLKKYLDHYPKCEEADSSYNRVIISTTLHTDINEVRLSIHPVLEIAGIVEYCVTIPEHLLNN